MALSRFNGPQPFYHPARSKTFHDFRPSAATRLGADYKVKNRPRVCRYGSSLGSRVSPRHSVAGYLGEMLAPYRAWAKRILVVRVDSAPAVEQFLDEEHGPAMKTFAQYFPEAETQFMVVSAAELRKPTLYYSMTPPQEFEVVAILGALADDAQWIFSTFQQMLPMRAGAIAALLAGAAPIEQVEPLRQEATRILPADVRLDISLFPARHDSAAGILANGLWVIEWRPANLAG